MTIIGSIVLEEEKRLKELISVLEYKLRALSHSLHPDTIQIRKCRGRLEKAKDNLKKQSYVDIAEEEVCQ